MWKIMMTITLFLANSFAFAHGNHETASPAHVINHWLNVSVAYLVPIIAIVCTCLFIFWQRTRKSGLNKIQ